MSTRLRNSTDNNYRYEYDNAGNRISKISKDGTTTKYLWDHRNRLVKIRVKNIFYNSYKYHLVIIDISTIEEQSQRIEIIINDSPKITHKIQGTGNKHSKYAIDGGITQ
ncbi:MAG: hypothetical protein LBT09_05975 [Planctomycetaceae bacterium]|nr:hypothetical protein [Planctomycetaceae bacterium]